MPEEVAVDEMDEMLIAGMGGEVQTPVIAAAPQKGDVRLWCGVDHGMGFPCLGEYLVVCPSAPGAAEVDLLCPRCRHRATVGKSAYPRWYDNQCL